ncbi:DUF1028 domain-containing protein [Roseomonas populi]|uniref:DUF1028 domain-containing protein n=1 Tax=Roseomonas populi TaxID=3121582 RepID=A0ABT1XA02_9PROT|nr:DUF1028 domain-containing protein [Roseomonas pecuniae]MCR0984925.1 DUF1028 domain-containing protein [Roseomonas pecuniae]
MTFSVAAVCPRTGSIGQALTTSSMAATARAMFMAPGCGAIFAQARSDPRLGAIGVERLMAGDDAAAALAAMRAAAGEERVWRQLAVLDAAGGTAHETGERCIASKGGLVAPGVLVVGNGLSNDGVIPAILAGFQGSSPSLPLVDRLLAALEAGEAAGGEPWPLRSAGVRVARPGVPFPVLDLRVELDDAPLAKLRYLCAMYRPLEEGYLRRTLDPDNAPPAAEIEAHIH